MDQRLDESLNPRHLRAIRNWAESDCQSSDPDILPSVELAPNWNRDSRDSAGRRTPCQSCARCRPEQRYPSGDWETWLYLAGRGAGKTRSAAEQVAASIALNKRWRVAVIAPTYADARDTCIEGESGILAVFERWGWQDGTDYVWNRSLGELKVKSTRSIIKLFSAEKPARLRGPQHHMIWIEELAQVVRYAPDAWDMAQFGLRLGKAPRAICTTTPLPVTVIKELLVDAGCSVTRGETDDNAANLPAAVLRKLHAKYDGTRLGRQELNGDLLEDIPGALWQRAWLDTHRIDLEQDGDTFDRVDHHVRHPGRRAAIDELLAARGVTLIKIVVAVDPAVTSEDESDESGVMVIGKGDDGRLYVLDDCTLRDTPNQTMERVIAAYDFYQANAVVLEVNNGGEYIPDMLRMVLKLKGRMPDSVRTESIHAKKGKRVRAEPASNLYESGNVSHMGTFKHTEDQVCIWDASEAKSPDRMDALVYGCLYLAELLIGSTLVAAKGQQIGRHQMSSRSRGPQMSTSSVGTRRRFA